MVRPGLVHYQCVYLQNPYRWLLDNLRLSNLFTKLETAAVGSQCDNTMWCTQITAQEPVLQAWLNALNAPITDT